MAWETQGAPTDRTQEHLGVGDEGVILLRKILREQIEIVRSGTVWAIRPARGCGIVPTVGVQCALDLVRDTAQQTVLVPGD